MSLINKYTRNPTDIKVAHITSKLRLYEVYVINITVLNLRLNGFTNIQCDRKINKMRQ